MAAHHYSTDPQDMIQYLSGLHDEFGMDIWVTEFACQVRCPFFLFSDWSNNTSVVIEFCSIRPTM